MARYSQADSPFGDPMNRPGPAIGAINPFSDEADDALKRGASFFSDGLSAMGQVAGSKAADEARRRAAKAAAGAGKPKTDAFGNVVQGVGAVAGVVGSIAAI